jgi:hypothetical protein
MRYFTWLLFMMTLLGCAAESTDEPSIESIVVGQMTMDQEEVSRVKINFDSSGRGELVENEGLYIVDAMESGDELWFHFMANQGELYKISWQDSWWEQYTAGSIFVTAYESDRSTEYFAEDRLIQMIGSPKAISIPHDGEVFLKVRGFDEEISGTFSISVEKIDKNSAIPFAINSSEHFSIAAGELILYTFPVEKNAVYRVIIVGSEFSGAYGDQIEVNVTALRENLNNSYFFQEPALPPAVQKVLDFTALDTETVYLAVIGAYWWEPRDVTITVNKI